MAVTITQNQVLGRGKLYFGQLVGGVLKGERYLGNTPEFSFSIETEKLDHFDADAGIKQKDKAITLSVNRSAAFTTDNVSIENLALFFLGTSSALATSQATGQSEDFASVTQGLYYQLGVNTTRPSGVRKVSSVVVKVGASTKAINTDYTVDLTLGRVFVVPGGGIADAATLTVEYVIDASTRDRVISSSDTIEGALRFVADNPEGLDRDFFAGSVKLSPTGDFALKGDDWQAMQFAVEIQKPTVGEAVYIDGRPA